MSQLAVRALRLVWTERSAIDANGVSIADATFTYTKAIDGAAVKRQMTGELSPVMICRFVPAAQALLDTCAMKASTCQIFGQCQSTSRSYVCITAEPSPLHQAGGISNQKHCLQPAKF